MELRGVSKFYGGVVAVRGLDVTLQRGHILALVGDNGAGKSTVLKIMAGAVQPNTGSIWVQGNKVEIPNPEAGRALGIEAVYQDLALVPVLSVADNMFLGRELIRTDPIGRFFGVLRRHEMSRLAKKKLAELKVDIPDVTLPASLLSGGQRQAIAISRATQQGQTILLLDEPTAALGHIESARLLDLIRRLRDEGFAIMIVSHNLEEVVDLADEVVVLRQSDVIGRCSGADVNRQTILTILHTTPASGGAAPRPESEAVASDVAPHPSVPGGMA